MDLSERHMVSCSGTGTRRPRPRPVVRLLSAVQRVAPSLEIRIRKALTRGWYEGLSARDWSGATTLLNYGYVSSDQVQSDGDPSSRGDLQARGTELYRRVIASVDLRNKEILEVGCGRGGGASFVAQQYRPRLVMGVDYAARAIAFCRSHHVRAGLIFRQADAERLPFSPASFDVVLNVESSHAYESYDHFVNGIARVLRPEGYFLFADFRWISDWGRVIASIKRAGFLISEEEDITAGTLRSLESDLSTKLAAIRRLPSRALRESTREFMAIPGSHMYQQFRDGRVAYLRFVLRLP